MKILVFLLSFVASITTIFAAWVSLNRHREIQDTIGPPRIESAGKRALLIGASIWLVLFGLVMLLLAGAFVIPAIIKLFV